MIDFGALACYGSGQEHKADYLTRELIKKIDDMPDTFFIINSRMTVKSYKYWACESAGLDCWSDYKVPANVFLMDSWSEDHNERVYEKIRTLLGLPAPIIDKDKYIAKRLSNSIIEDEEEDEV